MSIGSLDGFLLENELRQIKKRLLRMTQEILIANEVNKYVVRPGQPILMKLIPDRRLLLNKSLPKFGSLGQF